MSMRGRITIIYNRQYNLLWHFVTTHRLHLFWLSPQALLLLLPLCDIFKQLSDVFTSELHLSLSLEV